MCASMKMALMLALFGFLLESVDGSYYNFGLVTIRRQALRSKATARLLGGAGQQAISNANFSLASGLEIRNPLSLLSRQELECDPGYYLCPNDQCCEDGDNCVADGCCQGTQEQCGSDGCYDPNTEVCCSDFGTFCQDGYTCVSGGYCCPTGQELCGTAGCYDPKTEVCCSDSSTHCQDGYACVSGGYCCPTGQEQCGTDGCYDPDTQICCSTTSSSCDKGYDCVEGGTKCCPTGTQPCGDTKCYNPDTEICCTSSGDLWACNKGYECCELSGGCYEPDSEICCAGGACPDSDSCCENECCKSFATCGSDGFCTATSTPSTPSYTSTATTTMVTTATCTPTGTSNHVAKDTDPGEYLFINGKCLPVMDFVYLDGLTEELCESICGGIQSKNWPGRVGNSMMVLTKRGSRKQTPNCPGNCPTIIDPRYKNQTQCDEFPFGSTTEGGGTDAHTMCIVWWQNSIQGSLIRQYNRLYNLMSGNQFVVRVLPSCEAVSLAGTSKKRHDWTLHQRQSGLANNQTVGNETILSSSENKWAQNPAPGASNGTGYIFAPFGGVNSGFFDTQLRLQGNVNEVFITDGDGMDYLSIDAPTASEILNFTVPESDDLCIVAPASHNASVSISYTATVKPLPASSTTAASASSHIYGDWAKKQSIWYSIGGILVIWCLLP